MSTFAQIERAAAAGWALAAGCHLEAHVNHSPVPKPQLAAALKPGAPLHTALLAGEDHAFSIFLTGGRVLTETDRLALSADSAAPGWIPLPHAWIAPVAAAVASLRSRLAGSPPPVAHDTAAATIERIPELIAAMDTDALAGIFEAAMGQAAVSAAIIALRRRYRRQPLAALSAAALEPGVAFAPMADAVARIDRKTPVAARLSSAQWARVPLALRERAQFSAHVESIRFLSSVQDKLARSLAMQAETLPGGRTALVNRDSFIRDMRRIAIEEGIETTGPAGRGTIRDIRSVKRLGLIYDMQTDSAAGYARWRMDHDPDVLDAFPAYRLGPSSAAQPRPESAWRQRWMQAGSSVGWQGASRIDMVALKTSPIWTALSEFGTPWPPFDYGSTRELEDVDREEAEALGILPPNAAVPGFDRQGSTPAAFNDTLEASVADWRPDQIATMQSAFGDQVQLRDGKLAWQGNLIASLADDLVAWGDSHGWPKQLHEAQFKGRVINLGTISDLAVRKAAVIERDLSGAQMVLSPNYAYHHLQRHGAGQERRRDQRGLLSVDMETLPHVWRNPDTIDPSGKKNDASLTFTKRILGRNITVVYDRFRQNQYYPRSYLSKVIPGT